MTTEALSDCLDGQLGFQMSLAQLSSQTMALTVGRLVAPWKASRRKFPGTGCEGKASSQMMPLRVSSAKGDWPHGRVWSAPAHERGRGGVEADPAGHLAATPAARTAPTSQGCPQLATGSHLCARRQEKGRSGARASGASPTLTTEK